MRQIFTLINCMAFCLVVIAQSPANGNKPGFRIRCQATSPERPLFIIDGTVAENFDLGTLDPRNIENIMVLKDYEATALVGSRGVNGVVLINTTAVNRRVIQVKDATTGENLSIANVELACNGNQTDGVINLHADSSGCFVTDKIAKGKEYKLTVSCVGYKTLVANINSSVVGKKYSVSLQRDFSALDEVVVTAYSCKRTICRLYCSVFTRTTNDSAQKTAAVKESIRIYPNPVVRSQRFNIEIKSENEQKLTIRLFGSDSKLISSNEYPVLKGINKFEKPADPNLASGLYIIQLTDQNNQLIKSEKLIIQ